MEALNLLAELFTRDTFGWAWVWGQIVFFYFAFLIFHNIFGKHGR